MSQRHSDEVDEFIGKKKYYYDCDWCKGDVPTMKVLTGVDMENMKIYGNVLCKRCRDKNDVSKEDILECMDKIKRYKGISSKQSL